MQHRRLNTITPSDKTTRSGGRAGRRRAATLLALIALVLATVLCFPGTALADEQYVVYTDDIWSIWDGETPAVETESSGAGDLAPDGPLPSEKPALPAEAPSPAEDDSEPEGAVSEGEDAEQIAPDNTADDKQASIDSNHEPDEMASETGADEPESAPLQEQASEVPYDPESVMVRLTPDTTIDQLNTVIADASAQGLDLAADGVTAADLSFGTVSLRLCGSSVPDAIKVLAQCRNVLAAQPNYHYTVEATEGYVVSEGQPAPEGQSIPEGYDTSAAFTKVNDRLTNTNWVADAIHEREAWDLAKSNGAVAVAVIDTGADLDHPDLADRIVASYNSYDPSLSAEDTMGHGTHVAGIVAGTANNGVGLAGSSYDANLVVIKASTTGRNSFETASIVRAYAWLMEKGADGLTNAQRLGVRVVNMSVGGNDDTITANQQDDEINRAIAAARAAGILTVCAAGNKGADAAPYLTYPGDSDACLSVMNLKKNDDGTYDLGPTSNYNVPGTDYKDVCAPGTEIYSTWLEGRYAVQTGTSMASPLVAGIAALMFAANPELTPGEVATLIESTCADLGDTGWDERYGYGLVDARAAVSSVLAPTIAGPEALGIGEAASHGYAVKLGADATDQAGWTWTTSPDADSAYGAGSAVVDEDGRVTGVLAGGVVVRATKTAANGAEVSVVRRLRVLDASISGPEKLAVGERAIYKVLDSATGDGTASAVSSASGEPSIEGTATSTWRWLIDEGANHIDIFADGTAIARKAGTYTLRAISSINSKLTFVKELLVV